MNICVAKWLSIQEEQMFHTYEETEADEKFNYLALDVLAHIRFPMMTGRQKSNLLNHQLASRFKDFFLSAIVFAMHLSDQPQNDTSHLFVPRLYTCQTWCTNLIIENYPILPAYSYRTSVFSTPCSIAEWDKPDGSNIEWTVDLYPKGVWFRRFYLLLWRGRSEMPEYVIKSVRLSLSPTVAENALRATVGILVCGKENDTEHVRKVICRDFFFTNEERLLNLDDIVPYEELNNNLSSYLVGPKSDTLRVLVVVLPAPGTRFLYELGQTLHI